MKDLRAIRRVPWCRRVLSVRLTTFACALAAVRHLWKRVTVMHRSMLVEQRDTARMFDASAWSCSASLVVVVPQQAARPASAGA